MVINSTQHLLPNGLQLCNHLHYPQEIISYQMLVGPNHYYHHHQLNPICSQMESICHIPQHQVSKMEVALKPHNRSCSSKQKRILIFFALSITLLRSRLMATSCSPSPPSPDNDFFACLFSLSLVVVYHIYIHPLKMFLIDAKLTRSEW